MRLVYVILSSTFGMHQYTADIANRMASDNEVWLVTTTRYPADRYSPAVNVRTPVRTSNSGLSLGSLQLRQAREVRNAIVKLKPDVVHLTGPHLWNAILVRWLKRCRIPVIHTIHDLDPHHGARYGRLLHIWNGIIIRSADKILVHGKIYRQRLIQRGLASDSVAYTPLLHLFLGHDAQDAAEEAASDVSYNSTILFFGRLMEYKGVEVLLEAYSLLRKQKEAGRKMPQLVLAGSGSLKGDWSTRLPSGVEWRDRFIGDPEAMDLFRSCSLLILPYLDGTQSSIIASAYYFRKPVVATNVGAFAEYIDDGETGFLVAPGDPEAILLALLNLIDHESHLRTMGMAGREWYDIQRDQETETLVNLYQESHRQSN